MSGGDRRNADHVLIAALAGGVTVQDAAVTAGVGVATARRRLREPEFRRRVDEARADMIRQAVARVSAASTNAVATLRGLLGAESESVRLGAARSILELGVKLREAQDLAERIAALEARLELGKEDTPWRPRTA